MKDGKALKAISAGRKMALCGGKGYCRRLIRRSD